MQEPLVPTWRYDRTTLSAVQEFVERELLRRFDEGWLFVAAQETEATHGRSATVTFVFKRPVLSPRAKNAPRRPGAPTPARDRRPNQQVPATC